MSKENITITLTYQEFALLIDAFNKGITRIEKEEPYDRLRIKKANELYDKFIEWNNETFWGEDNE